MMLNKRVYGIHEKIKIVFKSIIDRNQNEVKLLSQVVSDAVNDVCLGSLFITDGTKHLNFVDNGRINSG